MSKNARRRKTLREMTHLKGPAGKPSLLGPRALRRKDERRDRLDEKNAARLAFLRQKKAERRLRSPAAPPHMGGTDAILSKTDMGDRSGA